MKLALPQFVIGQGIFVVSSVCLTFAFTLCVVKAAPERNRVFTTSSTHGDSSGMDATGLVGEGANRKYDSELLPAQEDREGNWGVATNGIQMSARFYKTKFVIGEPVSTVILLRNVGQQKVIAGDASWVNYPYLLSLRRNGGVVEPLLPAVKPGPHDGSASSEILEPGTQRRDVFRVDKIFDLSLPGSYELIAERGGFRDDGTRVLQGSSGVAIFSIIPKPKSSTNPPTATP